MACVGCRGKFRVQGGLKTRSEVALTPKLMYRYGLNKEDEKVNRPRCTAKQEEHG